MMSAARKTPKTGIAANHTTTTAKYVGYGKKPESD